MICSRKCLENFTLKMKFWKTNLEINSYYGTLIIAKIFFIYLRYLSLPLIILTYVNYLCKNIEMFAIVIPFQYQN